jgi:uncharacterized protein (DUF486 family)
MTTIARWAGRVAGAGLLGATAGIHAYLYDNGYKSIPKIGPMFLLLVIGASILCLAVLAVPEKFLAVVAASGALLQAATVIGLVIFTNYTIFNFRESTQAQYYWDSVIVEVVGFVILAALAVASFGSLRPVMHRTPVRSPESVGRG